MPTPAKPLELHILEGTYRKDRHGSKSATIKAPFVDAALIPPELGDHGAAVWARLAPVLVQVGLLTELDVDAFSVYCGCFDELAQCDAVLLEQGECYVVKGVQRLHPVVRIRNTVFARLAHYEKAFGLTPAARVPLQGKFGKADPDDEYHVPSRSDWDDGTWSPQSNSDNPGRA